MDSSDIVILDDDQCGGQNQLASAGKIQVLGLELIRSRLGDKWERMSDLVRRYFDAAIKHSLAPGDTFCRYGELSYLILFRDLSIAEAQLKCASVVRDVCRKLFGEESEAISARNLVALTDPTNLSSECNLHELNDTLERYGQEIWLNHRGCANRADNAPHLRLAVLEGVSPVKLNPREKPALVYRPLWDTSSKVVLTYLCQVLGDTSPANCPFSPPAGVIGDEEGQTTLDLLLLQECIQRANRLRVAGLRVLLATPCHYSTISRTKQWPLFRAILASCSPEVLGYIAFLVHGVADGTPHIRLSQELPKLAAFSKHLYCLVDSEKVVSKLQNTGVRAVGIACASRGDEAQHIENLSRLAQHAVKGGLDSFALGVEKRSVAINAIGVGIRYIEGRAVRPVVADPKNAFVQQVEDLYRQKRYAL